MEQVKAIDVIHIMWRTSVMGVMKSGRFILLEEEYQPLDIFRRQVIFALFMIFIAFV